MYQKKNKMNSQNTISSDTKNNRVANYSLLAIVYLVIISITVFSIQLYNIKDRLSQAEEKIIILSLDSTNQCCSMTEENVRLLTIDAAQKVFNAYLNSQSSLFTIISIFATILITFLVVLIPLYLNHEQGKANIEKINDEIDKRKRDLEDELKKKLEDELKEKTDKKITAMNNRLNEMSDKIKTSQNELGKSKELVDDVLTDLRAKQLNYEETKSIEQLPKHKQYDAYSRMIDEGRASSDTYFRIGKLYYDDKKYSDACRNFEIAIKNNKDYAEAFYYWALTLEEMKQQEQAWEKLTKAIELKPNDTEMQDEQKKLQDEILSTSLSGSSGKDLLIEANGEKFNMILVRGGVFTMGATKELSDDASNDEFPTHKVLLTDYYIGETMVTQGLWMAVMNNKPHNYKNVNYPIEKLSWDDAQCFIDSLNQLISPKGYVFRLPTEAEWEYAARGGELSEGYKYSGSNDINKVAWYKENSGKETHPVKTKKQNELGLYDMNGNVWEWCQDWFGNYVDSPQVNPQGPNRGDFRVCRSGSYNTEERRCRVSFRCRNEQGKKPDRVGFRLVMNKVREK